MRQAALNACSILAVRLSSQRGVIICHRRRREKQLDQILLEILVRISM